MNARPLAILIAAPVVLGAAAAGRAEPKAPAAAAAAPNATNLTVAQYRKLLDDGRKTVRDENAADADYAALEKRLSAVRTVTLPDGQKVAVHTSPFLDALDADPDEDDEAERFASALAVVPGQKRIAAKGDPSAQARSILAAKEFDDAHQPQDDDKAPAWWKTFKKWVRDTAKAISDWIDALLRRLKPPPNVNFGIAPGVARFVMFVLWFLVGVAALIAIYFLARTAINRGWFDALKRRRRKSGDAGDDLAVDLTGDGVADPLARAKALAAQGAYRDAIRFAYIASLRRLAEGGLLLLEPNRTNWEYQRQLRRRSRTAHDTLLPATRLFDRVWYGRRPATAAEFETVVRAYESLPSESDDLAGDGETPDPAGEEALRP